MAILDCLPQIPSCHFSLFIMVMPGLDSNCKIIYIYIYIPFNQTRDVNALIITITTCIKQRFGFTVNWVFLLTTSTTCIKGRCIAIAHDILTIVNRWERILSIKMMAFTCNTNLCKLGQFLIMAINPRRQSFCLLSTFNTNCLRFFNSGNK